VFAAAIPLALFVSALHAGQASARPRDEGEPRLVLAGDRVVRAGETIELHWTAADSVQELEILIAQNGRWECLTPSLDPGRLHCVCRIPDRGARPVRIRIRYNRGGREIEGPPVELASDARDERDTPRAFALPAAAGADESARTDGEKGAASRDSGMRASDRSDDAPDGRRPATPSRRLDRDASAQASCAGRAPIANAVATQVPEFVPLRT
jgi:hypothetical protein